MKKMRKPTPQPPRWFWFFSDGCWNCKNRNNCRRCKVLKRQKAVEKERLDRRQKHVLKVCKEDIC